MKTGACLPRGIRWLGLMALGGVSLAVQAEEKIVLLTSWYAQAEQGGYYQAQATGLYKKYGLDVEIRSGGPQVNGMQLLLSKRADVIIGYDLQLLEGIQRGFQAKAIAAPFQYDPGAADPCRCHLPAGAERQNPAGLQLRSGDVVAVAEGAIPAERRAGSPLYLQYSTLCRR